MNETTPYDDVTAPRLASLPDDLDVMDQYLEDVKRYPLLTLAEERELTRRMRNGDPDARQRVIEANLRFVISVAKKFQNRGLPLTDLIAEGNTGLLRAADKFDPNAGVKFISYAVWWIRQAIGAALARQGRSMRVPLNRTADLNRSFRAAELLRQRLNREPTDEEIATIMQLPLDAVRSLRVLHYSEVRLDAVIDPSGGDRTVGERLSVEPEESFEERVLDEFLSAEMTDALATLYPRDARVLRLYFGMEGGREHTLEEIGRILGVTRERVRQLRDRALLQLRHGERASALRSFTAA